jgi:molybdopterin-synthase adenylyltransferase
VDETFQLKPCVWERVGDALVVVSDRGRAAEFDDPGRHAEQLLSILKARAQTLDTLRSELTEVGPSVTRAELADAVTLLDSIGLLESAVDFSDEDDERYRRNLGFLGLVSSLGNPRRNMQQALRRAHVLQLGVGGAGCNVLPHVAGMGVGHITVVDMDVVELGNLNRQYLYRYQDIGRSKAERAAEWLHEFDPTMVVDVVERRITDVASVCELLTGVDAVSIAINEPRESALWVNEACVKAGVPMVGGGQNGSKLDYFSVDPGNGPCFACFENMQSAISHDSPTEAAGLRLAANGTLEPAALGAAAGVVGGLVAFELMRYLTGFEPPDVNGATVFLDAAHQLEQTRLDWTADPDCRVCASAPSRLRIDF